MNGFWKPPPAFRFGFPSASESSASLWSSERTRFALFFLAALGLGFALGLATPAPRVTRPRDNLFSCACSSAARRASASSLELSRFCFLLGGSETSIAPLEPVSSSEGERPLVSCSAAAPDVGVGTWATSADDTASNRASIRLLMAICGGSAWSPAARHAADTDFLLAKILFNGLFQTLPNLLARHGLEVGRGEDAVDDAGVGARLLVGHCYRLAAATAKANDPA